jgi:hypothetical protein
MTCNRLSTSSRVAGFTIRAVRITVLSYALWTPAEAKFTHQGSKLSGVDVVGRAAQGQSVSISADGTRRS